MKNAISLNRFEQINRFFRIPELYDMPKSIKTRGEKKMTDRKIPAHEKVINTLI